MIKKFLFLQGKSDLAYAVRNRKKWHSFIPAHQQLDYRAVSNNLKIITFNDMIKVEQYELYTQKVANTLDQIDRCFTKQCPNEFKDLIKANLARDLYFFELFYLRKNNFGEHIFFRDQGKIVSAGLPKSEKFPYSKICLSTKIPEDSYVLDLQTPSGLKTGIFSLSEHTYKLKFVDFSYMAFNKLFGNSSKSIDITLQNNNYEIEFFKNDISKQIFSNELHNYLIHYVNKNFNIFSNTYASLEKIFNNKKLPCTVYCNAVSNFKMAACLSYFSTKSVDIKFQSHGGLHIFGTPPQITVTKNLSNSVYNYSPSAGEIHLRSKLQKNEIHKNKPSNVKMVKLPLYNSQKSPKFTILIAPNFTNWSQSPWGIHSTCYDTIFVLKNLSRIVEGTPEINWLLRLKFSLEDKPSKKSIKSFIGIEPESVRAIFNGINNIIDVSKESYQQVILSSDLVITEGITSVPYDAWEKRKPVLFLRSNDSVRGLHRRSIENRLQFKKRSCYYSTSCKNLSKSDLYNLKKCFSEGPLRDDELCNVLNIIS